MSVLVMSWVLRNSPEKWGRRLVLLAIADHANDDGTECWASVATLAHKTRMSERQVRTCLRELEQSGAIVETGRTSRGTHNYTVIMVSAEGGEIRPPENLAGAKSDAEGGEIRPKGGAKSAPEPSLDPSGPVLAAANPPEAIKIDGRNLPYDVLAEVCGIEEGSPRARSIPAALNGSREVGPGIRRLVWERAPGDETTIVGGLKRSWAHPDLKPGARDGIRREFEHAVAVEIRHRAKLYGERFSADVEMTPTALAKWFLDLGRKRSRPASDKAGENLSADRDSPLPKAPTLEERKALAARIREMSAGIGKDV
jgi:hypothetical protein